MPYQVESLQSNLFSQILRLMQQSVVGRLCYECMSGMLTASSAVVTAAHSNVVRFIHCITYFSFLLMKATSIFDTLTIIIMSFCLEQMFTLLSDRHHMQYCGQLNSVHILHTICNIKNQFLYVTDSIYHFVCNL